MKLKLSYPYLALSLLFLFVSACSSKDKHIDAVENSLKYNAVNPFYIDKLVNPPLNYGSIWFPEFIKKITINQLSVVLKGGKNPEDVYEKQVYKFNEAGNLTDNEFYHYVISDQVQNQVHYHYSSSIIRKIDVFKYLGNSNQAPVFVQKNEKCEFYYKPKFNQKNDTLFFYPSMNKPEVIIQKIGNIINHMEVIVDKGASADYFMNRIKQIDSTLLSFEIADKIITYTENNLPIESFQLTNNWNVMEMIKKWEYNKFNQPIAFYEWLHGTKIKDISIKYNENALPKKYIFNKKTYTLIYKKV